MYPHSGNSYVKHNSVKNESKTNCSCCGVYSCTISLCSISSSIMKIIHLVLDLDHMMIMSLSTMKFDSISGRNSLLLSMSSSS